MMKFKNTETETYSLLVRNDDTVLTVKRLLGCEINKNFIDIILIYANKLCSNNELIGKYGIKSDHFVLFECGDECREFNDDIVGDLPDISSRINRRWITFNIINEDEFSSSNSQLTTRSNKTIDSFKIELVHTTGWRLDEIKLWYRGHLLSDGAKTLEECLIEGGHWIGDDKIWVRRNITECQLIVHFNYEDIPYEGSRTTYFLKTVPNETIGSLKKRLSDKFNLNVSEFELQFDGSLMSDERTVGEYDLYDGAAIYVFLQLYAGGIFPSVSFVCLDANHKSFESKCTIHDLPKIIDLLSTKFHAPINLNIIELFADKRKINRINSSYDISQRLLGNTVTIYFEITRNKDLLISIEILESYQVFNIEYDGKFSSIIDYLSNQLNIDSLRVRIFSDKRKVNQINNENGILRLKKTRIDKSGHRYKNVVVFCSIKPDFISRVSFKSLNLNGESFDQNCEHKFLSIISCLSKRFDIPAPIIKIFSDKNKRNQINNDDDVSMCICKPIKENWQIFKIIDIYYLIEPKIAVVSLGSINENGKIISMECNGKFQSIIDYLTNLYDTKPSIIKIYSDKNKCSLISKDEELYRLERKQISYNNRQSIGVKLYYYLEPLIDNIIINKTLGKGSFGEVYMCTDIGTNIQWAIKKLYSQESYMNEISIIKSIPNHPKIISMDRFFERGSDKYIVMKYMLKGSVGKLLRNGKKGLPEHQIARYGKQILEGLNHLHSKNFIHRDIKGDNILLDENDNVKLCDFGLAEILSEDAFLDRSGGLCIAKKSIYGTVNWMAPEVLYGKYGFPSDVWSFGATIVEMITAKPPNSQLIIPENWEEKILSSIPKNSTGDLKSFVKKCIKRHPDDRASIAILMKHEFLI